VLGEDYVLGFNPTESNTNDQPGPALSGVKRGRGGIGDGAREWKGRVAGSSPSDGTGELVGEELYQQSVCQLLFLFRSHGEAVCLIKESPEKGTGDITTGGIAICFPR